MLIYAIDHENGKLVAQTPAEIAPGSGPRHLAFHPDSQRAYVINELSNTITAFDYDADAGTLATIQIISTLPDGYAEVSHTADIHVHPNGRFLYGSNRGHDSIAVYAIDQDNGQLALVEIVPTGGANPRNFGLDPTGTYLVAGNHSTNDIFTFRIDPRHRQAHAHRTTRPKSSRPCATSLFRFFRNRRQGVRRFHWTALYALLAPVEK